jgi:hypothetical protein
MVLADVGNSDTGVPPLLGGSEYLEERVYIEECCSEDGERVCDITDNRGWTTGNSWCKCV